MTREEAIRILDPETSREALGPYRLDCALMLAKTEEACRMAARDMERLADYESTGLTLEDIQAGFSAETALKLCAQTLETTTARLRELTEADRDGRLMVMPEEPALTEVENDG